MSEVLALKYRPSSFDKLIGQESITQTLTHALDQNRLSHAYLFSGLRGSGKTSTARIFAKALLCENGPSSKPCEECENCKLANQNRHIDIIEMDAASSRKIDDIRDLIEQTKYKPNIARFKIFIIDEVHMLTKEAFNALLKTLEEPPDFVKFILATTDPLKLPATILSRTQHFRFRKIAQSQIIKHLAFILDLEGIEYEKDALSILARAGNGSLRDTLTLLDQAIIYSKKYVDAKSVASMLGLLDTKVIEQIFNAIILSDKKELLNIIKELEAYEAEVVIDEMISYLKNLFFEDDARVTMLLADRFFRLLAESKSQLYLNADSSFTLMLLFFKMVEANKIQEVQEAILSMESNLKLTPSPSKASQNEKNIQEPQKETQENLQPPVSSQNHFEKLIQSIYNRNYELGECFESNVKFIEFEENILTLSSSAQNECQKLLRDHYSIIKNLTKDIYGIDVVLKVKKEASQESTIQKESPTQIDSQPSSCVESQVINQKSKEVENILEDPFVKKATELFEPSKIVVKSKI
ncbi:MAG: DNA polymerase III subunit gamma/tau [Sulfurospirillum sp.]|nr:MAG: DNA polymerase III subunit gamma/tau [Sulfurospirillum sp.]